MASTVANSIDPALVARFRSCVDRLNPSGEKIGLAVSGGPDSLGLMLLAHAAIPEGFEVATVNHGVRPEAGDECALVEQECAKRGIPCVILSVTLGKGNLQQEARKARYAALGRWAAKRGLVSIATGHQADDQRETFLMRLARGSGVAGLSSIREKTKISDCDIGLIRPVLEFSRLELAATVTGEGIDPVRDPSNRDDAYDRVRLRKALAENAAFADEFLDGKAISTSAANLADADAALEWAARREWDEHVTVLADEIRCNLSADIPRAVSLRVAHQAIGELGGRVRGGKLAQLQQSLAQGGKANLGGVLIEVKGGEWIFRKEPPRNTG